MTLGAYSDGPSDKQQRRCARGVELPEGVRLPAPIGGERIGRPRQPTSRRSLIEARRSLSP
jgi:hypothetical protein